MSWSTIDFLNRGHPYYIFSYDYRETSSGVRVLHLLCHFLNKLGYEAYVTGKKRSPALITHELTDKIISEHQEMGLIPVKVYPEVLLGDPLPFGVTARYLLNKPGYFLGKHSITDDELIFYFRDDFNVWPDRGVRLGFSITDPLMFRPPQNIGHTRHGFAIYMNHYIELGGVIDDVYSNYIEISPRSPVDYHELPNLFRKISALYCYEVGQHVHEARLCGCPVILIPNDITLDNAVLNGFFKDVPESHRQGILINPTDDEIIQAELDVYSYYDKYLESYVDFSEVNRFAEITQLAAKNLSHFMDNWNESYYLNTYPDVRKAVMRGKFKSGLDHFKKFGEKENRNYIFNGNCFSINNIGYEKNGVVNFYIEDDIAKEVVIHLVVYVTESGFSLLADTLDDLSMQVHEKWYLSIISDSPCPDSYFEDNSNIEWKQIKSNYMLAEQFYNSVAENTAGWVFFLECGLRMEPTALSTFVRYICAQEKWKVIYMDEDLVDQNQVRHSPCFKPDFNLDLLRSMPYMGMVLLIERDAFLTVGGGKDAPYDYVYDLILKILDHFGEKVFGHVSDILFHLPDGGDRFSRGDCKYSLIDHITRCQISAVVVDGYIPGSYRIEYQHLDKPKVSIIIPTKDRLDLIQPCIETLFEKTAYRNFEVIVVDNQSESQATKDYLKGIQQQYGSQILVIDYPEPYNYSAINNFAAQLAKGDYLLLLNNDTVIIQDQWLERMLNHGQREEVGIVGARLVFPNQTLQHAGVILGMGAFGVADHPHISLPMMTPGYMNRAQVVQNFSAVTAACMLIRKSVFFEVGGLDEVNFKVLFNDVDLCLKVRERGYKIVWTPYATVVHHGSSSIKADRNPDKAKRARQEADKMLQKWLPQLANDPAYNRNLSLKHRHFQIETETDVTWNVDFHDRPRIYAFPANDSGVGEYRVRSPLRALTHAAKIQSSLLPNHSETLIPDIVEIERAKPDVLLLQNGTASYLLHAWEQYRKFNDVFMIYSQDDLIYMLPGKHPLQGKWPKDLRKRLRKLLEHSDRLIVATEPLKIEYSRWISDVKIVPNYLEKAKWLDLAVNAKSRDGKKMRVGWAGGAQHQGDLEFILPVVEATKNEVDWIFMGMCPEQIRPFIKEYHAGVHFDLYPQKLADLDLDLAIAPLEYNNFNMAKTNLRLLEYGVLGWPVVCSDITPYRNAPVTRVSNNVNHWIKAIREKVNEPDALVKEGQVLKQWVLEHYLLEDHLDEWMLAITPS